MCHRHDALSINVRGGIRHVFRDGELCGVEILHAGLNYVVGMVGFVCGGADVRLRFLMLYADFGRNLAQHQVGFRCETRDSHSLVHEW